MQYLAWLEADLAAAAADPRVDWILAGGVRRHTTLVVLTGCCLDYA